MLTCALAIAGYWLLVDFPDSKRNNWSFLGARERQWVVDRIARDRGDSEMPAFNLRKFLSGGADWKIWAYAMIFFNTTTLSYALAYTLPLILMGRMGFTVGEAQCLVAPPYAFAGIIMLLTGWAGDKFHVRGPIILFNMLLCLIGLPIMGWADSGSVRYFGVFLVTAGANANIPAVMSFQANNVRGQWKRAFCSATLVGFGGIGGIAGSLVFREQDAATGYKPGQWACIACCLLTVILVTILDLDFRRQNAKADRGEKLLEAHDVSCHIENLFSRACFVFDIVNHCGKRLTSDTGKRDARLPLHLLIVSWRVCDVVTGGIRTQRSSGRGAFINSCGAIKLSDDHSSSVLSVLWNGASAGIWSII